jgi:hypothetical protein
MTVSDVLDGIFKILKANFRTIAVIVACVYVPVEFAVAFGLRNVNNGQSILKTQHPSVGHNSLVTVTVLLGYAARYVLLPYIGAAIAVVASASYLGRQIGAGEALAAVWRRKGTLFCAWAVHLGGELVATLGCGIGLLFAVPLFLMIAPVVALEGLPFWKAVRRSWRLAARRYWPTLGTTLLCGVMAYFLGQILGAVPNITAQIIGLRWGWLLLGLGESLAALIVTPVAGLTAALLYFDARIRTEGLDLQLIAGGLSRGVA